jgi:hypothetical protein
MLIFAVACEENTKAKQNTVHALGSSRAPVRAEKDFHLLYGHYGTLAELGPQGARLVSEELAAEEGNVPI